MRIRVVTVKSPWETLAEAGLFAQGERFRDRPSTATSKGRVSSDARRVKDAEQRGDR